MTALDDIAASARSQADAYGQSEYTRGKADQAITDAAALASVQANLDAANHTIAVESQANADLQAKYDAEQAALVALQAVFDQYKIDHPAATPPPPPPPAKLTIGMNFAPSAQGSENLAKAARIFVADGQTSILKEPEFVRARAAGVTTFILSHKDTTIPAWYGTIPKGLTWYGVAHHEPEEMTASAWKALQAVHMPAVRAAGGIPTAIFTAYSVNPKNPNLKFADWVCPVGTHDVLGIDYYPDKSPNLTQAQMVALWKPAMKTFGVTRFLIGEYGVIGTTTGAAATVAAFRPLIADLAEVACYWSAQAKGKPDYHFTAATSAAWFTEKAS